MCDVCDLTLNSKDLNADRNVDRKDCSQEVSDGNKQSTGDYSCYTVANNLHQMHATDFVVNCVLGEWTNESGRDF